MEVNPTKKRKQKKMKKALITGILGQDGANMADYLLKEADSALGVFGMMRRTSNANFSNIPTLSFCWWVGQFCRGRKNEVFGRLLVF